MFDPFAVLGLEKVFALDLKALDERYFEAQRKTHPDRLPPSRDDLKENAARHSTVVNQAYLLLKDPLERARFLLKEQGIEPLAQDSSFLQEVMLWNERLEAGEDLKGELHEKKASLFKALENAFVKRDYETARGVLYQLTYVEKLLKGMKAENDIRMAS